MNLIGSSKASARRQKKVQTVLGHVVLILFGITFFAPFLWLVSTSLKPDDQVFSERPVWIPRWTREKIDGIFYPVHTIQMNGHKQIVALLSEEKGSLNLKTVNSGSIIHVPTKQKLADPPFRLYWENYPRALTYIPFFRYVENTLILAILSVIGSILSCSLVAYSFSRIHWPGRDICFFILLATLMLPGQVTMIPVFMIFKSLGWVGSMKPLVVPAFFGSAFFIFLLRQFFMSVPHELSDAGKIDGCSEFQIYWKIVLPLAKPALATVGLFTFMGAWNDFLGPLLYLNDETKYTLSLGLQQFVSQHGAEWSMLMAASTVMTIPIIVLFFLAQRTFIQGITLTGIKG
jgi:multiple sugar transport system permease protein